MEEHIERLQDRMLNYRFFSNVFLALPDENFVRQMLNYPEDDETAGAWQIRQWARANAEGEMADVLKQVSVDRTRLFRGLSEVGPVPPYESLFVGGTKSDPVALSSVAGFYSKIGFQQVGGVHDSPEYMGNEMAFMDQVLSGEMAALKSGDAESAERFRALGKEFLQQHLGCWVGRYAEEMKRQAQTDLYRGLACMMAAFIEEEKSALR